jgi:hypothetical protein
LLRLAGDQFDVQATLHIPGEIIDFVDRVIGQVADLAM